MKEVATIWIFILLALGAFAQESDIAAWRLTNLNGELKLEGLYREQQIVRSYISDDLTSYQFLAGIRLNTHSYIYHPNFLQLDLNGEFAPERNRDDYIIIPDRGEVRTTRKIDLHTYLFQGKFISFNGFAMYSRSFSRRENLTNLQTDAQSMGGGMVFRNSVLPVSVQYRQGSSEQVEINSLRIFKYDHSTLEARTNKSFGSRDKHELVYSLNKYARSDRETPVIRTYISDLSLQSELYFDPRQRHRLYSRISFTDNAGYDTYRRLQAYETISLTLPYNLSLLSNYTYHGIDRAAGSFNLHNARTSLRHQLFASLRSEVHGEYNSSRQPGFRQIEPRAGIDINYLKQIPKGNLNISYRYLYQHQARSGDATTLDVYNEGLTIKDGQINLLTHPYINANSVVVTDETGSIIYQLNFDYLLIPRGNFLEIVRVAGGQIPDGSKVYVNYTAVLPGNYSFDMHSQVLNVNLNLFKQLIGIYYQRRTQDYTNLFQTDFITLNYLMENVYGIRMDYRFLSLGAEYDDYDGSILPYKMKRVFLNVQGNIHQFMIFNLNADLSEYHLVADNVDNTYANIAAMVAFMIKSRSKLSLDAAYRQQVGDGINLDLMSAKIEYAYWIRQLQLSVGLEAYRRDYMKEIDNYNGLFIRVSRRF